MTKIIGTAKWLVLLALLFALFMVGRELLQSHKEKSAFQDLAQAALIEVPAVEDNEEPLDQPTQPDADSTIPLHDLAALKEQNSDFLAWLTLPGTQIDYPIVHTPHSPQKYLRLSFDGQYSISGVPFLQENCSLESQNLVIYGHNMNNGTMFSDLTNYVDPSYSQQHPLVRLETAEGIKEYTVYAVAQLKADDSWYYFESVSTPEQFEEQIELLSEKHLYATGDAPKFGQQLLTLSTCYGKEEDDRLMLVAILQP